MSDPDRVCSTEILYHYLLNDSASLVASILEQGLRPLSDFPRSQRWQQIQAAYPGFFEWLYREFAEPVLQKPYLNSGVFLTPIDFRRMPGSLLFAAARLSIPLDRLAPEYSCLTYELDGERVRLPLTTANLQAVASLWTRPLVERWFGVDSNRLFYYVPQVVTYQPGGVAALPQDLDGGTR